MSKFNSQNNKDKFNFNFPIIPRLVSAYEIWQNFLIHFPKTSRYTLGTKIDNLFLEIIETIFKAVFQTGIEKLNLIKQAISRLDLLKFLLQIAWQIKAFDNKKYIHLSKYLNEIGKMLGGWRKDLLKKTSAEAEE